MNRFSIIQKEKKCLICGTTQNIHIHEVFYGRNRKNSIEDGCCVYLCGKHHNQSRQGVHFNEELDNSIKKLMETFWLEYYNKTVSEFIQRYRRNYL